MRTEGSIPALYALSLKLDLIRVNMMWGQL